MNPVKLFVVLSSILAHFAVAHKAIIGGTTTTINEFRYLVSLLEVEYGHLCGGTIIGEQYILSAAHCFLWSDNTFKSRRVFALMGTSNLMKMEYPTFNTEVVKIYVPKEYVAGNINTTGDIAVLKVKESLQLGHFRDLKALKTEINQNNVYSAAKAIIAGWGWYKIEFQNNQEVSHRFDSLLRYAKADIFNQHQCQLEHPDLKISDQQLCARVEQKDHEIHGVCYGDNGGPLVHDGKVIGVLSLIPNTCSERTRSAIYTRVSHYLTFIRNAKRDYVSIHMRAHVLNF